MTQETPDLEAAMLAGRRGDRVAYAALLAEIARRLRPRLRRALAWDPEEIEDVVQETLLALHLKNASWDAARPLMPWVHAIADHKAADAARRRRRRARLYAPNLTAEDVAEIVPEPAPERDLVGLDLERCLAILPARQRDVVRALALEGGTVASVAARFAIGEGAVRIALHRGLKKLAAIARRDKGGLGKAADR